MFFHYFGLITFTIIVAVVLAVFVVSCCKGHYLYYQFTKPQLRAYDNKLQYYKIDCDKDKSKWVPLRCTIMRKYHPRGDENKIAHQGESVPIRIESIDELNEYRKKLSNYNKLLDFIDLQETLMKDYNSFDEQQRIIQ